MGKQELRQEMLNYIDELEEERDAYRSETLQLRGAKGQAEKCKHCDEADAAAARAETELAKVAQQRNEFASKLRELTEARDKALARANDTSKDYVKLRDELEKLKDPAKQVKLTFEQKVDLKYGKIGEKLCESYNKHEKSQVRWLMVARDAVALLGARLEDA
jgi:uncharacterized protein (DUF3084 family)